MIESYNDKKLTSMLFVDGCSLLYFMENLDTCCPEALKLKLDQLMYIWRDIGLLENQLPMSLLELLSKNEGANLQYLLANFNSMSNVKRNRETIIALPNMPKPTHMLDYGRACFIDIENGQNNRNQHDGDEHNQMTPPPPEVEKVRQRYKNTRDLRKSRYSGEGK